MKCKLYECEDEAYAPFQFCSGSHNWVFKNRQSEMPNWFDADKYTLEQAHYNETKNEGDKPYRANYTVEEIEILAQ